MVRTACCITVYSTHNDWALEAPTTLQPLALLFGQPFPIVKVSVCSPEQRVDFQACQVTGRKCPIRGLGQPTMTCAPEVVAKEVTVSLRSVLAMYNQTEVPRI